MARATQVPSATFLHLRESNFFRGHRASNLTEKNRKQRSTLVTVSVPILNARARLPHLSYFLPRTALNIVHTSRVLVTALKTSSLEKSEKMMTSWGSRLSSAVEMKTPTGSGQEYPLSGGLQFELEYQKRSLSHPKKDPRTLTSSTCIIVPVSLTNIHLQATVALYCNMRIRTLSVFVTVLATTALVFAAPVALPPGMYISLARANPCLTAPEGCGIVAAVCKRAVDSTEELSAVTL